MKTNRFKKIPGMIIGAIFVICAFVIAKHEFSNITIRKIASMSPACASADAAVRN